jgi:hypothetical protein
MGESMKIWKTSAVGPSVGGSVKCNECGVIIQGQTNPAEAVATIFCQNCQNPTMAINFIFCTGDINPLKAEFRDRRFSVIKS